MRGRAEFTVEPFVDADPGPHVVAAIAAVRSRGFEAEVGPFGTAIAGEAGAVTVAIADMLEAARAAGATRVALQIDFTD
jgi:uncharacterized protein YqgV (UPF0045/DUF77 family)